MKLEYLINYIVRIANLEYERSGLITSAMVLTEEDIRRELHKWIVYFGGSEAVGCVRLSLNECDFSVAYLSVLPEFRRQGIGTKLYQIAEQKAIEQGGCVGWVMLRKDLEVNQKFFEKMGYKFHSVADPQGIYLYYKKAVKT
ncbi:GNAT family N-acetyltransferase [Anoxybacteroides amylolyticum]|uniref:Acetyltransferase domain protein n=1 Tax=Anoxybacteroides amylolyticum TaxID=294699 RepID=A0A167TLH7_9BACL|nr:GNAT family N-acetyltransferase [Anoxybacillus amylolyticus]ANB61324.1 acetyltransferase domain protein [Anoxybacillus amylolyticus]